MQPISRAALQADEQFRLSSGCGSQRRASVRECPVLNTVGCVSDVTEVDGTLTIQVRGRNKRLVPVRLVWAGVVVEAIECLKRSGSGSDRFLLAQGRNAANETAARLAPVNGEGLSSRRAEVYLVGCSFGGWHTFVGVAGSCWAGFGEHVERTGSAGVCQHPDPELAGGRGGWRMSLPPSASP